MQDQALLLVEFDHELMSKQEGADPNDRGIAITLLVDHIHSIPVRPSSSAAGVYCSLLREDTESCAAVAHPLTLPFPVP